MPELISMSEANRRLDEDYAILIVLVRTHRIPTHRMALNGKAKGLDPDGLKKLAHVLAAYRGLDSKGEATLLSKLMSPMQAAAS